MIFHLVPPFVIAQNQALPPGGTAIVAKANGDALIMFDVSGPLVGLMQRKASNDETMRAIEVLASGILVDRGKALAAAQTVTVRVVYPHRAELNPKYGVEVIQTLERLMTLKATRNEILKDGKRWPDELRAGKKPAGLTLTITGELPPFNAQESR